MLGGSDGPVRILCGAEDQITPRECPREMATLARDAGLLAIDVGHLFGSNTTRIGLRRGTYIRQYEYDFIQLFASQLSKKAVDMAMAGPGADDEYQL